MKAGRRRRFGNSTPESIRESHEIVRRVMAGEVTPHCQRAQTAFRVARKYPLWAIGDEEAPPGVDLGWSTATSTATPETRAASRQDPAPAPARGDRNPDPRDREAFLQVLFGDLAPHAESAFAFMAGGLNRLTGGRGEQLAGVAAAAALPLLVSKVNR